MQEFDTAPGGLAKKPAEERPLEKHFEGEPCAACGERLRWVGPGHISPELPVQVYHCEGEDAHVYHARNALSAILTNQDGRCVSFEVLEDPYTPGPQEAADAR